MKSLILTAILLVAPPRVSAWSSVPIATLNDPIKRSKTPILGIGIGMGMRMRSTNLNMDGALEQEIPIAKPAPATTPSFDQDDLNAKLTNALFLGICFGGALYTIINIDHGMTRGWTQSEIAMRIPMDTWSSYESALSSKPVFTKTVINVVIYLLGDWLSQTLFAGKNILDFSFERTLKNGLIGLCFGPLVHQYYEWSDYILPVEGGLYNRVGKIFMDQTLYLSIKCSIYIAAVGLLAGDTWEEVQQNVKSRIGPVCLTAWKFWPLVHCVTYGVIPARHRVLWVNSVDLIWNAILATLSQDAEEEAGYKPQGDVNEAVIAIKSEGVKEDAILDVLEDISGFAVTTESDEFSVALPLESDIPTTVPALKSVSIEESTHLEGVTAVS